MAIHTLRQTSSQQLIHNDSYTLRDALKLFVCSFREIVTRRKGPKADKGRGERRNP